MSVVDWANVLVGHPAAGLLCLCWLCADPWWCVLQVEPLEAARQAMLDHVIKPAGKSGWAG